MNKLAAVLFVLLLLAFFIYFAGTPFVAGITGLSPQTVSLSAGIAVVVLGAVSIVLTRLWSARRSQIKE
jgi:hypothetical protein